MPPKKRKTDVSQENQRVSAGETSMLQIEGLAAMQRLKGNWPADVSSIFCPDMEEPRRQELWELIVHQAVDVCDRFAWAIPDDRALRILKHFSPIVEIGAGAGYWAHCMRQRGIECSAFDRFPPVSSSGSPRHLWTEVEAGGPEVLLTPPHSTKTLLLCYPDDFEESQVSMAALCLESLQSDTLVHCGELFGDCPMLDKAPWGRTSGSEFQQHLFTMFRCVLKVPLPSWPHSNDHLSVWRRVRTCTVRLPTEISEPSGSEATGEEEARAARDAEHTYAATTADQPNEGVHEDAKKLSEPTAVQKGSGITTARALEMDEAAGVDAEVDGEPAMVEEDGDTGQESDGGGEDESEGDESEIELVCDFRKFVLTTEQPKDGWAIEQLKHLL